MIIKRVIDITYQVIGGAIVASLLGMWQAGRDFNTFFLGFSTRIGWVILLEVINHLYKKSGKINHILD